MSKTVLHHHHRKVMILKGVPQVLLINVLLVKFQGQLMNLLLMNITKHPDNRASRTCQVTMATTTLIWRSREYVPHSEVRDDTANSNEGPNVSSSMMDAMKKINKDKVKAALEKRRKSKGDVSRKVDVMDDDDIIERELEHGVELAAEDEKIKQERRQSWPHPSHREDQQNANRDNAEEGELSMDSLEYRSPEPDNRKRKDAHEHRNYDRDERDLKRLRS
ncbi:unnamed protein product [Urochloa humidicola]